MNVEHPYFSPRNVRNVLEKFPHFSFGPEKRWRYVDLPPPLCKRDRRIHERYGLITRAIDAMGGEASWTEIVDQVQRHHASPDEMTGDQVSKYLRTGPYAQLPSGRWKNAPNAGYVPLYSNHQRYKPKAEKGDHEPFDPDDFDPGRWDCSELDARSMASWERVVAMGRVLMALGGVARPGEWYRKVQEDDPEFKEGTFHGLLRKDPHFGRTADRQWTCVPGPSRQTPNQLRMAVRRKAVAEAIAKHGGAATLTQFYEHVPHAVGSDGITMQTLGSTLSHSDEYMWVDRDKAWRRRD